MSDKPIIVVTAQPNPDAPEETKAYLSQVLPLLQAAGGVIVRRARVTEAVVGEQTFGATLVMEFPSAQAIRDAFGSEDYAKIAPHRERGFRFMNIVIAEPQ